MADLSEHFGPVGEFFILAFGLFLLLLMIPGFRRELGAAAKLLARGIGKAYLAADRRFPCLRRWPHLHRWTGAFTLIFRDRRDLLLIVLALIVFDYALGLYAQFALPRLVDPHVHDYPFTDNRRNEAYWIADYLTEAIRYTGYGLFCWLAFQRGQDEPYEKAAAFRPYYRVLALALCIAALTKLTKTVNPFLFLYPEWIREPGDLGIIATNLVFWASVSAVCMFALNWSRREASTKNPSVKAAVAACLGFVILNHLLQWLFWLIIHPRAAHEAPPKLAEILYYLSNFNHTALSSIVLVAFAVMLTDPAPARRRSDHPALSV